MSSDASTLVAYRVGQLEAEVAKKADKEDVDRIEAAVNRLIWAIVGFSLTVAGSAVMLVLTVKA